MADDKLTRDILTHLRHRYFGKYRGIVHSDLPDPTHRGRIEVEVPAVLGDQHVWAMPCVPYAGKDVGFHMLPAAKSGVWVEFEAGDINYPIWSGCYWATDDVPTADARESLKFIRTPKFTIRIDDAKGELTIEHGAVKFTMNTLQIKLEAPDILSTAKTRNLSVNAARVSINDGTQEVT